MGFGIERRARSRKAKGGLRALLGRAPDAREVGERIARLAKRMFGEAVRDVTAKRLTLSLHPAASPVRVAVLPDGDLEVRGDTGGVGPGYHAHVLATLAPLLDELEYAWDGDEPPPREAMARWFADELARGVTRIGVPADRAFLVDAAVLTALGPRDASWRDAVIAEPSRAADAFPWWDEGPGTRERSIALLAMWHEVPWREPLATTERALMERVDVDLRAARAANPTLELPWAAWAELLAWLGEDAARIDELRARDATPSTIGYRRYPLEVELPGGWLMEVPGAFLTGYEDDGARYWATDGDRALELTSLTATTDQDSQQLLDVAPEQHPVIARIDDEDRRGRVEAYDEGELHIVHGLMVAAPEIAIVTFKGAPEDEAWALATWRTLRPATSGS